MTFDPSTLAGKRLWLRAKDNAGINGSLVNPWIDQSGAGHNGIGVVQSPSLVTEATPLGGKAVQFSNNGYFSFGPVLDTGGEAWVVVKAEIVGTTNCLWKWNDGVSVTAHSLYPANSGVRAEGFGVRDSLIGTATDSVQSWKIYRVTNDGTTLTTYLDGVQKTSSTVAAQGGINWSSVEIGTTLWAGAARLYFTGKIAEVFVRSQVSTTQEVADITAYLTAEHFVASVIPAGPTAQMAFSWGGTKYTKGDLLPAFRPAQMRHLRQRGYADSGTTLVVGKPFLSGGVLLASGAAMPAGLTDAQLRRLIASRHLV